MSYLGLFLPHFSTKLHSLNFCCLIFNGLAEGRLLFRIKASAWNEAFPNTFFFLTCIHKWVRNFEIIAVEKGEFDLVFARGSMSRNFRKV